MFRKNYPIAWHYHKNTCRSLYNLYDPKTSASDSPPYNEYPSAAFIPFAFANAPSGVAEALRNRSSCRDFDQQPITLDQLAITLDYSYGIRKQGYYDGVELFERFAPSGGGLYPLELYLLVRNVTMLDPGIYHYVLLPKGLEQINAVTVPDQLVTRVFMNQYYINKASVIIIAAGVVERIMWKYGDRGYRYMLLEAGHVFQNMNLIATSIGLGHLNLGGFFDDELAQLLGLQLEFEVPIYAMALGVKKAHQSGGTSFAQNF